MFNYRQKEKTRLSIFPVSAVLDNFVTSLSKLANHYLYFIILGWVEKKSMKNACHYGWADSLSPKVA
jgi:hypothetical protein